MSNFQQNQPVKFLPSGFCPYNLVEICTGSKLQAFSICGHKLSTDKLNTYIFQ